MTKNKTVLLLLIIVLVTAKVVSGQEVATPYYPKTGEVIRDYEFKDVINNEKRVVKISDYSGQWLVLDFWSRFCTACINSFPRMDSLSRAFNGKAKIIMVGCYSDKVRSGITEEQWAKTLYRKQALLNKLNFTVAFDKGADAFFDVSTLPHIMVIDPGGKVVAKTVKLDSIKLQTFLNGKIPNYERAYSDHEPTQLELYDRNVPLLSRTERVTGSLDSSILYRSVLVRWNESMPTYSQTGAFDKNDTLHSGTSEIFGVDMQNLLHLAHTGSLEWSPADSLRYTLYDAVIDERKRPQFHDFRRVDNQNLYCYSLTTPSTRLTFDQARACLLDDIKRAFRFTTTVEPREVTVLDLVVKDKKKVRDLKSNEGKMKIRMTDTGYVTKGLPIYYFISNFLDWDVSSAYGKKGATFPPIYDKTKLDFTLDINFDLSHLNYEQIKEQLNVLGFDLVERKQIMPCIVVKDLL